MGFDLVGLSAYSVQKPLRIATGGTQVCRIAKFLARRRTERALRRLEKRLLGADEEASLESCRATNSRQFCTLPHLGRARREKVGGRAYLGLGGAVQLCETGRQAGRARIAGANLGTQPTRLPPTASSIVVLAPLLVRRGVEQRKRFSTRHFGRSRVWIACLGKGEIL